MLVKDAAPESLAVDDVPAGDDVPLVDDVPAGDEPPQADQSDFLAEPLS